MKNNWIKNNIKIDTLPEFRKVVSIKKRIKKAILFVTCIGLYDAYINDKPVTNSMFKPGYTNYYKRVQYQTYDVTNKMKEGDNSFSFLLAKGWASSEHFSWCKHPYYDDTYLNVEIRIEYQDKTKEIIYSDESFDVYTSKIISSEIYDGEEQDLRIIPKYVGKASKFDFKIRMVKQEGEEVIEDEIIYPRNIFTTPKNELMIDFGQNFTGNIVFEIDGKEGEILSFLPAEVLTKEGNFYFDNYRDAKSYFKYTLTNGKNILRPLFSFQGLRYIKLVNIPSNFDFSCVKGHVIHSRLERTCYFDCGNEKINQLYHNIIYGQLSNYLDIPTDCPQRDERLGWLGDAQVFVRTASINFNVKKFFKKWLHDLNLGQHEDGSVEGSAPIIKKSVREISSGWGDAITICPYEIYLAYGDKKILKDSLPHMKKWVEYIRKQGSNEYLWDSGFHFGDWVSLDAPYGSYIGATDVRLIATAYYAISTKILASSLKILGKDSTEYDNLYVNIINSFQDKFLKDGLPIGEKAIEGSAKEQTGYTQCALSLIINFDLGKKEDIKKQTDALVELIEMNGMRMTTGFIGTPYILRALTKGGRSDIAYKLLLQEKAPSWIYSINKGATTMWEHWDCINDKGEFWSPNMNSFNHYAYGSVFDWIFNYAAGINPLKPGYEEVLIKPYVSKDLGHLDVKYKTKFGLLCVRWYFQDNATIYEISIPKGIKARVEINNSCYNLEEGKYMFSHI